MLEYYARWFSTVEINATFYASRPPDNRARLNPAMAENWIAITNGRVQFCVKAPRVFSHERRGPKENGTVFKEFLAPLIEARALGCVLIQFPQSFRPGPEQLAYVSKFRDYLRDVPVAAEFRHRSWAAPRVFELLVREQISYVCVDEPQLSALLPPIVRATAAVAYVRFHGRNAERWYDHEQAWQRYDYSYTDGELEEWAGKLEYLASAAEVERIHAFFNNHAHGQAVDNARRLRMIIDRRM